MAQTKHTILMIFKTTLGSIIAGLAWLLLCLENVADYCVHALVRRSPFRHRHILTRHNNVRWRYKLPVVCVMAVFLLSGAGALTGAVASYMKGIALPDARPPIVAGTADETAESRLMAAQKRLRRYHGRPDAIEPAAGEAQQDPRTSGGHIMQAGLRKPALPEPKEAKITIGNGDTLGAVLQDAGASARESYLLVEAMKDILDPRDIKPGQKVFVRFDPVSLDQYALAETNIAIDPIQSVSLHRNRDGQFEASFIEKELETHYRAARADIEISLYGSAAKAGVPASVIADTIGVYSWDVDFQRDIRRGDEIELLYEELRDQDDEFVKNGAIIYARLNVNGQDIPVYRYEMSNGNIDYFTADGKSVRKALMKTPINGARLSSGFGRREHPVLGYTKIHKGLDFAAPRGTPIYAAGDGTIERASRWSSFGNYVRIRHNSQIKTAYAHMKGFAKGITAGTRVKQGQVIGYVGTTGRSTGPHLHYEVLKKGTQVNPRTLDLPQGETLKGEELTRFKARVVEIDSDFRDMINGKRLAHQKTEEEGGRYN